MTKSGTSVPDFDRAGVGLPLLDNLFVNGNEMLAEGGRVCVLLITAFLHTCVSN